MWYRVFVSRNAGDCEFNLGIFDTGWSPGSSCGDASFAVDGNRVDLFVPKSILDDPTRILWRADVGWWDFPNQGDFIGDEVGRFNFKNTPLGEPTGSTGLDLSEADGVQSQLLEVFHYPVIQKTFQDILPKVFARVPDTEMAIVLTDFRADDIFGHGGSTGGVNVPIQGIGDGEADPWGGIAEIGSTRLQVAAQPTFVGQQRFDEVTREGSNTYIHHAGAIGWMAHELGHRWGIGMEYIDPSTGQREDLVDTWCFCHWDESLHAPSVTKVGSHYTQGGYESENSPMGGFEWRVLGDNRFSRQFPPYLTPYGFSALDLYSMGLMPASEVPDTFVLQNLTEQGNDVWTADRVDISIEDVIAAEGPRLPSYADSQKEFELTVYVIYDPANGPVVEMVERAMRIAGELKDYFERATGGRMSISLGGDVTNPSEVSMQSETSTATDTDGDGVPDEDDLCPTFAGSPMADGC
jgi:hypothetical protein